MSIYKLGELIVLNKQTITKGNKYNYIQLGNIKNQNYKIIGGENEWVNRAKWLINEPMILISRVYVENRNNDLIYPGQIPVCASNAFICFKSNKKAKLKYLWYKLNAPKFINYMIQHVRGTIHPSVNLNDFLNYKLQLPDLNIQQKIIDIIEPIIKLINYIEKTIILLKKTSKLIVTFKGVFCKLEDLTQNINKGFAYKKEHLNPKGMYKIFTIKNITNKNKYKCSNYFLKNLLRIGDVITGLSGSLGTATVINENNWVSNQRTLSFETNYSLLIQEAIIEKSDEIKSFATGSVQKNITAEDILNLQIKISHRSTLKQISKIHLILLRINSILEAIKIKYINVLIK